ncbi:MAG: GntP family permease, partial [Verrucomicrobiales bacterium]|nr:GntP family permease [Verrucomicrobiales bacterium]
MTSLWLLLLGLGAVVFGLVVPRWHAFLAMILAALVVALATPQTLLEAYAQGQEALGKWSPEQVASFLKKDGPARVMTAFGETCGKMGLLIAMASIIGRCLLDSGAALRIVRSLLGLFGQARVHLAFIFAGFGLAIPVYFDSVFYLLMPIGKAMARTTGRDYLLYILTIVAGATMAHSLVPPTPGPLFAARELGVSLPMMMAAGGCLGLFTASTGLLWALWANRRFTIPVPEEDGSADPTEIDSSTLPSLGAALVPILIPLGLISAGTLGLRGWFTDPSMALTLGALAGLLLLRRWRLPGSPPTGEAVQAAIMS